jgi:hypothetical protein
MGDGKGTSDVAELETGIGLRCPALESNWDSLGWSYLHRGRKRAEELHFALALIDYPVV